MNKVDILQQIEALEARKTRNFAMMMATPGTRANQERLDRWSDDTRFVEAKLAKLRKKYDL